MIRFQLNGLPIEFSGNPEKNLLSFLRNDMRITSLKDGCSGEGICGACLVEMNGTARLACKTQMEIVAGKEIFTLDGIPETIRKTIANAFVIEGAVQCGFCSPGFVMRTHLLLARNPNPGISEIRHALKGHLCRCTGYKKIETAILQAAKSLANNEPILLHQNTSAAGKRFYKYQAFETALGKRAFVNDLHIEGQLFGALKFSDHPRAKILSLDVSEARKEPGVIRIFTAADIPGNRYTGLIFADWPLMIASGEITRYIGDVICAVVAENEEIARKAMSTIRVEYEVFEPVTVPTEALLPDSPTVHPNRSNLLDECVIRTGNVDKSISESVWIASGTYETQRVEHAFLECESALALPDPKGGLILYSQGQGVYEDRRQIASLLGIVEESIVVHQVANGGGFGGKEDLSVQGHAALFAWLLKKPVKVTLSRPESIRMHPKRHPVKMDITLSCDAQGNLTALKLRAIGDSGAYASVGNKVMERLAGHATGGYFVPVTDIESKAVYTNNIPCGAMRGFGVNQVAFALEACIDELCKLGGFDRWKFRYQNALVDGLTTATGQKVKDAGIRACLDALKDKFYSSKYAGLACGIKNSGVGNGMPDFSDVIIEIKEKGKVIIRHGWTEMGQGVHSIAIQVFCGETGIPPQNLSVVNDTSAGIKTGMTTSSRATALLGNALIDACVNLNADLKTHNISELVGKCYRGRYICDWTTKPGANVPEPITHYSYGYAAQLVVLDDRGKIEKIYAAHDAGKIMNPTFFEGQIEGAVHMGAGYALSENLAMKDGYLISDCLADCGILRAHETPEIEVIGVEVADSVGPYGAKGVGEIGLVPTAAAIANAKCIFDGIRRYKLPLFRQKK